MDYHIDEFYQRLSKEAPRGNFHDVIALHRENDVSWTEAVEKAPQMLRGWHELAHISSKDRIGFVYDDSWRTTDSTGITHSSNLLSQYEKFQALVSNEPFLPTIKGAPVDPKSLISFYESFGTPYYQCFCFEWYPEEEMENVSYSNKNKTISDVKCANPDSETLAFPTFNKWPAFYLERIN